MTKSTEGGGMNTNRPSRILKHRWTAVRSVVVALLLTSGCGHHRPVAPLIGDEEGSFVFFETPEITHTRDYYSFAGFVPPETPTNWLYPVNYRDGSWRLTVEVTAMRDPTAVPLFYTVTWSARVPGTRGFLRVSVNVDRGPGVYEATASTRDIEWSPDGGCCQTIDDKYWPWENAWSSVAGDIVAMAGGERTFPVSAKVKLVFFSKGMGTQD